VAGRGARAISAASQPGEPSFPSLEWSEWFPFGARAKTVIKIDRASGDRNARRWEPSSILLYNYDFFVRAEADPHRFERFALIRLGQVECVKYPMPELFIVRILASDPSQASTRII